MKVSYAAPAAPNGLIATDPTQVIDPSEYAPAPVTPKGEQATLPLELKLSTPAPAAPNGAHAAVPELVNASVPLAERPNGVSATLPELVNEVPLAALPDAPKGASATLPEQA